MCRRSRRAGLSVVPLAKSWFMAVCKHPCTLIDVSGSFNTLATSRISHGALLAEFRLQSPSSLALRRAATLYNRALDHWC